MSPVNMDIRVGQASSIDTTRDSPTMFLINDIPVFAANSPNVFSSGVFGVELMRTFYPFNPIQEFIIEDIHAGNNSSFPREFTVFKDQLFFVATSSSIPAALWTSKELNATTTTLIKDIFPNGDSKAQFLEVSSETLFFAAQDANNDTELWKSNGTASGTIIAANINTHPNTGSFPEELTNVKISGSEFLFFTADDSPGATSGESSPNRELWVSAPDGTVSLVADLNPAGGANPRFMTDYDNQVICFAEDENGYALWTSDGTSLGTEKINLGGASLVPTTKPVVSGGLFYFVASDVEGAELWAFDGQSAFKVSNINPGANSSNPTQLTDIDGTLYFAAARADVGVELFKSDGTTSGTQLVENIVSGPASSFPAFITNVGGVVYFYVQNINANPSHSDKGYLYSHDPFSGTTSLYYDFLVSNSTTCNENVGGARPGSYGEILPLPDGSFYFIADGMDCRGAELWYAERGKPDVPVLTLINSENDSDIMPIDPVSRIELDNLPTQLLNIKADISGASVGSVLFELTGDNGISIRQTENIAPYAIFGDDNGDFKGEMLVPGEYTLKVTLFSEAKGNGIALRTTNFNMQVISDNAPEIAELVLINADTDTEITVLKNGTQMDIASIGTNNLTIVARTNPSLVGSVAFELTGPLNQTRVENAAPYALFGDSNNARNDFFGTSFSSGNYTITAAAFEKSNATGATNSLTLQFSLVGTASSLKVYPNKVKDGLQVTIEGNTGSDISHGIITVYDILGKEILRTNVSPGEFSKTIQLDQAQEGVYIIDLNQKQKTRLLIEK